MNTHKKILLKTAVIFTATVPIWWVGHEWKTWGNLTNDRTHLLGGAHSHRSASRDQDSRESRKTARVANLKKLKGRWLALKRGADTSLSREALAEESAQLLLCTDEALDLMVFLSTNEMGNERIAFETSIYNLFESSVAVQARDALLQLSDRKAELGCDYRENWSYSAGRGCQAEDFEFFHSKLAQVSEGLAQEALIGRNKSLIKLDPESALKSTLELLNKGIQTQHSHQLVLSDLMWDLPPEVDFKKIDELLPAVDPNDSTSPVNCCRPKFFEKWAEKDPVMAAEYVMAHPDRFKPEWLAPVAGKVMSQYGMESGVDWIQKFPPGPYLDSVIQGTSAHLYHNHPEVALELAAKIQDEKTRNQVMEKIERVQRSLKAGDLR